MSTKTSIKRIALVAVSALGFGLMSVVPVNASVSGTQVPIVATITNTTTTLAGRVGNQMSFNVSATLAGTADSTTSSERPSLSFAAAFTERPSGAAAVQPTFAVTTAQAAAIDADLTYGSAATAASGTTAPSDVAGVAGSSSTPTVYTVHGDDDDNVAAVTTAVTVGTVTFTPTIAGTYKLNVWNELNITGTASLSGSESYKTFTIIVSEGISTVTLTKVTGDSVEDATYGAIVKVEIKDAAGNAGALAAGEAITLDPSLSGDVKSVRAGATGSDSTITADAGAAVNLTSSDFSNGVAYVNIIDGTAETTVLTATLSSNSSVSNTASIRFYAKTDGTTTVAPKSTTTGWVENTAPAYNVPLVSSVTFRASGNASAETGEYVAVTIRDISGKITGLTDAYYDRVLALTDATATAGTDSAYADFAISATFAAAGQSYSVSASTLAAGTTTIASSPLVMTATAVDISAATINGNTTGNDTVSVDNSSLRIAPAGTASFVVTVSDQFGKVLPNSRVTMTWAGRNTSTAATQKVGLTNSDGVVTLSYTDSAASTVTATADTVTFTASDGTNSSTSTATINWLATTVGTVTILGGNNTTTGVAATSPQWKDIAAGDGAETGAIPITATVKDANGALLVGVPVTFSVSGEGVAILSTQQTVYTGTSGTAASSVYAWLTGSYTVTATAGAVSGTSVYQFRQSGAGEQRTLSASVNGSIVTAKVVDRFGNPVPSVTVYATKTGSGYFGSGTLKSNDTTDNNGEVSFIVNGGEATVTVATYDAATAVAPLGSGQTCAREGALDCNVDAADDTEFTAYTAGTSLVAEEGVGASFDAAGVASATVTVTAAAANASGAAAEAAADAALEAIDAANAATDAANLAAEAADAATVAAEEARDAADAATAAVEALASEVATLIAGLKAQITTLAKTVAKIAKKVKA